MNTWFIQKFHVSLFVYLVPANGEMSLLSMLCWLDNMLGLFFSNVGHISKHLKLILISRATVVGFGLGVFFFVCNMEDVSDGSTISLATFSSDADLLSPVLSLAYFRPFPGFSRLNVAWIL